jgi:hypothetical protein
LALIQPSLGDAESTEEVEYYDADYADDGEPFATFHFYYRSMGKRQHVNTDHVRNCCYNNVAALKDLHIVERTPDPLDLLDSDDTTVGQMNREQLEAIVRRFRVRLSASSHHNH